MRHHNLPLASLESHRPLTAFDMVGFSLQYELVYTNVLNMLELGGIPVRAANRNDGHPLVIAGGPCAFNPAPMAAFIDAFVIGEGEEVILEIAAAVLDDKRGGRGRPEILSRPGRHRRHLCARPSTRGRARSEKRIIDDLNAWSFPPGRWSRS